MDQLIEEKDSFRNKSFPEFYAESVAILMYLIAQVLGIEEKYRHEEDIKDVLMKISKLILTGTPKYAHVGISLVVGSRKAALMDRIEEVKKEKQDDKNEVIKNFMKSLENFSSSKNL